MRQPLKSGNPSRLRVILAFLIVPGTAAFAMATVMPLYAGIDSLFERIWRTAINLAVFGAYPSALIFGTPTYFFLRQKLSPTWVNCSLAGAFVAAIPWFLIMILGPSADQASIGDKATVIDGSRTLYGWMSELQFVGQIGLSGALAGLLFWMIISLGTKAAR